jgi:hypothetical protein
MTITLFVHRVVEDAFDVYMHQESGYENYLGSVLSNEQGQRVTMLPVDKKGWVGIVRAAAKKAIKAKLHTLDTLKIQLRLSNGDRL